MRFLRAQTTPRGERGQDLIELALVLPVLLIILVGVVDLGRAFQTYLVLTNAAREGARQGTLNAFDVSAIQDTALHETRNAGLADSAVTVSVVPASSGQPVRVSVQYDFPLLSGVLPASTVPLSCTVEMVAF
jgi:Flp pilus assembly protein TadG